MVPGFVRSVRISFALFGFGKRLRSLLETQHNVQTEGVGGGGGNILSEIAHPQIPYVSARRKVSTK